MEYGFICILPPIIVIATAILTKRTISSLVIGALLSYLIAYKLDFFMPFVDLIYSVGTNADTIWILLFTGLFGCILAMLKQSGALTAFSTLVSRYANTEKKTLLATWILGVVLFVDDFMSVAVRGTLTPVYDKNKIPRPMLAYICDSTASPMCILIPFGTWAIFYQAVFGGFDQLASFNQMDLYIQSIPFMFYGWAALLVCFLAAAGIIPPLGAMKASYKRARETGELYGPESKKFNELSDDTDASGVGNPASLALQLVCFIIPMAILIPTVILTGDILIAILVTAGLMIPLYLILRVANWAQLMDSCLKGFTEMLPMMVIVFAALMFRDAVTEIGLPEFVVYHVEPFMSPALLPAITFLVCTALTFTTGSNWGVTVAVSAVVIPLCFAVGAVPQLTIAAIVSGAAFGAHMCFYCDVTVFTSMMSKVDNMEHALTQLPYGIISMVISLIGFVVAGFMV